MKMKDYNKTKKDRGKGLQMGSKAPINLEEPLVLEIPCVALYPLKLNKTHVTYAGEKKGEKSRISVRPIKTRWGPEIEVRGSGEYHIELITTANPEVKWDSYWRFNMQLEEANKLSEYLLMITNPETYRVLQKFKKKDVTNKRKKTGVRHKLEDILC